MTSEKIIIPVNKRNLKKALAITVGFSLFSVVYFIFALEFIEMTGRAFPGTAVAVFGAILFFAVSCYNVRMIFDNSPALIIDDDGIYERSGIGSVGLIPWDAIKRIEITNVFGTRFIALFVNNPETFMKRKWIVTRIFLIYNQRVYGTPIHIPISLLDYDYANLYDLIQKKIEERKK